MPVTSPNIAVVGNAQDSVLSYLPVPVLQVLHLQSKPVLLSGIPFFLFPYDSRNSYPEELPATNIMHPKYVL